MAKTAAKGRLGKGAPGKRRAPGPPPSENTKWRCSTPRVNVPSCRHTVVPSGRHPGGLQQHETLADFGHERRVLVQQGHQLPHDLALVDPLPGVPPQPQ